MKLLKCIAAAALTMCSTMASADAPDVIKVGYISTLSGPAGSYGQEMLNAYNLGLEHTGNKLGGIPVELVTGDSQAKPQIGIQLARQMMQRDKIHLMSGLLFSHVGEAVNSVVIPTDRLVVATVGGSSALAGEACNQNFFIASWNTDTMFEAIGAHLAEQGVRNVAVIATNYQAGWDSVDGLKRGFGGDLSAEILVQLNQSDFGAELSQIRAAAPEALVLFLPGGSGIAFQRQFHQSGLQNTVKPYVATFQADETTFGALGETAVGLTNAGPWSPYLENDANKKFVDAFKSKYERNPSILAAMAYDTVLMLDAAVSSIKGDVENTAAMREALRSVSFESIRGKVSLNKNHFPVQDFYISRVERNTDGNLHNALVEKVFSQRADAHSGKCKM
ncbi:MAG: ABC transporter substrate-binding protein [Pseudomonadota bacterium]